MDTSLAQGPNIGGELGELASAPIQQKPSVARSLLGEIYGHPIRNAMWQYALTPWNISNYSKGFRWKGFFGYRGLVNNQRGTFSLPTTALRRLIGGIGETASIPFGKGAQNFWRVFGRGGFEGLSKLYKPSQLGISRLSAPRFTSEGLSKFFEGVGKVIGGSDTPIGTLGSTFGKVNWEAFGRKGPDQALANSLTKMSKDWYGWRTAAGKNTERIVAELGELGLKDAGAATKMTQRWIRGMNASRLMGTYATASLIWDVAKYAAKGTYKITRYALENINSSASGLVRQEWGDYAPVGLMSAGAVSERQRALDEIQRSSMNARSLIGNEASMAARTFAGGRVW